MVLPAPVEQLLRAQNIVYRIVDMHDAGAAESDATIRCTLLRDGNERLQVLYPASCLLDLGAVNRSVGGNWRAMARDEVLRLCRDLQVASPLALPGVLGVPALADQRLLDRSELQLAAGDAQLLRLDVEQFRRSLADAPIADVAVPLATLRSGPLDEIEDIEQITRAVASFTQLRIRQRLEETLELPPLPVTAQEIIKLRVDPYADVRRLAEIVEMDPALAAQVVGWANSPYYAAPGKVRSVHDAIARVLGFDLVLNLALGLALGKSLELPKDAARGGTPYWQNAVFCATAVEALIGTLPALRRPASGLGYLAGLLHNFGYLVMAEIFPPHFSTYCRFQEANPTVGYSLVERHLLGITRDQLAGWLMRFWTMPEEVIVGLRYQATPEYRGQHREYAGLVLVAKRLLRLHGVGDAALEPVPAQLYAELGLDPGAALQAVQQVMDASAEIQTLAHSLSASA